MTLYALLLHACGLSHREAADLHGVRIDTVKSWASGRNRANPGVIGELRTLARAIAFAADQARAVIARTPAAAEIEIGYPVDDYEARFLGLPCLGAWRAMVAMVVAGLDRPVTLVPRGSTPATAKAADAHGLEGAPGQVHSAI